MNNHLNDHFCNVLKGTQMEKILFWRNKIIKSLLIFNLMISHIKFAHSYSKNSKTPSKTIELPSNLKPTSKNQIDNNKGTETILSIKQKYKIEFDEIQRQRIEGVYGKNSETITQTAHSQSHIKKSKRNDLSHKYQDEEELEDGSFSISEEDDNFDSENYFRREKNKKTNESRKDQTRIQSSILPTVKTQRGSLAKKPSIQRETASLDQKHKIKKKIKKHDPMKDYKRLNGAIALPESY